MLTGGLITLREVKFRLGINADAGNRDARELKVWLAAWREGGDASSSREGRREGETRREGGTNIPDISASQFAGGWYRGRRDHAIGR